MGAVYALVVIVVLVLIASAYAFARVARQNTEQHEQLERRADTVEYDVPNGHDPAAILSALSVAGFEAAADPRNTRHLQIACPPGQRDEVRRIIQHDAPRSASEHEEHEKHGVDEPVRFTDE